VNNGHPVRLALGKPELVQALLRPEAYPEEVASVEMVETHVSYLFFTGRHVYKVKKPVDYGFLDFTTLEKRRYYCDQEVEVNRRMSPDVYLGVVEIREQDGKYAIEGSGRTVEYAVKMRQLPRERAMNVLLKQNKVTEADIRRLAVKIANFHRRAETSPPLDSAQGELVEPLGGLETLRQNIEENFRQTEKYAGLCLSQDAFDDLLAYSQAYLDARKEIFTRRAREDRIRDCHGDLHTAQIFLVDDVSLRPFPALPPSHPFDGISVIDSIEFNPRFRYSDVGLDVAFLAMDLDFHGRRDLSEEFVRAYVEESGDLEIPDLLDFFKLYRAYVRGKVTSFRLDAPDLSNEANEAREAALVTARSYLRLAHSYVPALSQPSLFMVTGLMGTGKSYVSRELARRWDLEYISSDVTRKELAGVLPHEHRYEAYGYGIYSSEFSRRTYQEMVHRAHEHLGRGRSVVLDASFRAASTRREALDVARKVGADAWIVECVADETELRFRLERRLHEEASASDGRWELLRQQKEEWEPVSEVPESRHIRLDTSGPPGETMRRLLEEIYIRWLGSPTRAERTISLTRLAL